MADACQAKEEDGAIGFRKSKNASLPRTTLASVESLTVPMVSSLSCMFMLEGEVSFVYAPSCFFVVQVQEVVLLADFQCAGCQKRVADIISRMNGKFFPATLLVFTIYLINRKSLCCDLNSGCGFLPVHWILLSGIEHPHWIPNRTTLRSWKYFLIVIIIILVFFFEQ